MIRNLAVTAIVSIMMGVFAVAYTAVRPPETRSVMTETGRRGGVRGMDDGDAPASSQGADLFRERVRFLLASRCVRCHNALEPSGGLDLTRRAALLAGGDSGPAVVPGKPEESLLVQLVEASEMPKEGASLIRDEIAALRRWILLGAPFDQTAARTADGMSAGRVANNGASRNGGMTAAPSASGGGGGMPGGMNMCPCMQMMMGGMKGSGTGGMMGGRGMGSPTDNGSGDASRPIFNPRTKDQARKRAEEHLKARGNPNLKLGEVRETISAFEIQVVTQEGSAVNWIIIDKQSGRLRTMY